MSDSERFPNVVRTGVCYIAHIRVPWTDDVTRKQKGPGEVSGYVPYLLRLWRERGSVSARWRASLQDPHSGKRVGFAHLEDVFDFLRRETGEVPEGKGSKLGNEGEGTRQG